MNDKHDLIVDAVLDSLSNTLDIYCSWIQTAVSTGKDPYLASYRNFNEEIYDDMSRMRKNHPLFKTVVGFGNKLVISNLSMDGVYGMNVFEKAGYHSLIAVPITTYKVLGIMGAVDRKKSRFNSDFTQLFAVVANLVGVALSKDMKTQVLVSEKDVRTIVDNPISRTEKRSQKENKDIIIRRQSNDSDKSISDRLEYLKRHNRKMGTFRKSHNQFMNNINLI